MEINPRTAAIAKANRLNVILGTLEQARFPDHSFDYVHMGDLIEHVTDPRALIKETHRILKPNGSLIIVTPNMDCFWAKATFFLFRLFKLPWSSATPPHHLFQFSISNLRTLLEQEGFSFGKVWFTGTPSLKYELGSLHLLKKWKNQHSLPNLFCMIFGFGLYSIVFGINRIVELFPVKRFSMAVVFVFSSSEAEDVSRAVENA